MVTLSATKRNPKENLAKLRSSGRVPAVYYGPKEESTPISVDQILFEKAFSTAGESTVITLQDENGEKDAIIHDVSFDPLTNKAIHADFYIIEKGKKVTVAVPVEFTGVSPAVKELGGVLVKVMHELEIEAFPKDLPHALEADISKLVDFTSHLTVADVKLPSGVSMLTSPEEIVALVSAPKEEKEEEAAPMDLSSIEVEKKGKEETEEGEGTAAEGKADQAKK